MNGPPILAAIKLRKAAENAVSNGSLAGPSVLSALESHARQCQGSEDPIRRAVSYALTSFLEHAVDAHTNSQMLHSYTLEFTGIVAPLLEEAARIIEVGGQEGEAVAVIAALSKAESEAGSRYRE